MRVSIIVLNYKTADLTIQTVKTLLDSSPWILESGEIIVVDNDSQDGSAEKIKAALPQVTFIQNDSNSGFTGGNNVGIRVAQGEYVILLNSDTISIEDAIGKILDWMDEHQKVGVSSVKLLYEDKSTQENGGYFPTLWVMFLWVTFLDDLPIVANLFHTFHPQASKFFKKKTFYDQPRKLDWVTGAFMVLRKKMLDEIGLLDEHMFMYTEDCDMCYRAKQAGYETMYMPIASIIHLQGKSSPTKRWPTVSEFKNVAYFYHKHQPGFSENVCRLLLKLGALIRIVMFGFIVPKEGAISIYAEAFRSV